MDSEIEEAEDRIEVDILGRNLGTASGWDGEPSECISFYEFQPRDGIKLKFGELQVDFTKGLICLQDPEGEIEEPKDLVEFLYQVERL